VGSNPIARSKKWQIIVNPDLGAAQRIATVVGSYSTCTWVSTPVADYKPLLSASGCAGQALFAALTKPEDLVTAAGEDIREMTQESPCPVSRSDLDDAVHGKSRELVDPKLDQRGMHAQDRIVSQLLPLRIV
jgi:hypothetical protein